MSLSKLFAICLFSAVIILVLEIFRMNFDANPRPSNEFVKKQEREVIQKTNKTLKLNVSTTKPEVKNNSSKLISILIKPGSKTYFTLDNVKEQFIKDIQNTAKMIHKAIHKYASGADLKTKNSTRAILAYLPAGMQGYYQQAKALYLSIALMRIFQPENIKTDFIIYTPEENLKFPMSFGCTTEVRTVFGDSERCTVIPFIPMKKRFSTAGSSTDPLLDYAAYIDSIQIVAEFNLSSAYDFTMRADLDTFLTPGFGDWLPAGKSSIAVGIGGYGSTNANAHLKWISNKKLGLNDTGLVSLGATWYGGAEVMVAAAKTTVSVMRWLHTQEFNEFEICCSGTNGWPHWHWPVIMLYGMHIAINQLGPKYVEQSGKGVAIMDAFSTSNETLSYVIKHIHCWHTEELFSKFKFNQGKYSNLTLDEYVHMGTLRDYSTVVAVSSDRLSEEELKTYISNPELMKQMKWIRAKPLKITTTVPPTT